FWAKFRRHNLVPPREGGAAAQCFTWRGGTGGTSKKNSMDCLSEKKNCRLKAPTQSVSTLLYTYPPGAIRGTQASFGQGSYKWVPLIDRTQEKIFHLYFLHRAELGSP